MFRRFSALLAICALVLVSACDSRTQASGEPVTTSHGAAGTSTPENRLMDRAPDEDEVRSAAQSANCELVEVLDTSWPDDTYRVPASYDDAKVTYVADCQAKGGHQVRRVTYEAQFGAVAAVNTGSSQAFWELRLNQPSRGTGGSVGAVGSFSTAAEGAAAEQEPASGNYSDGPECNALLGKLQAEVIPCVEDIDPQVARRIQSWLEITSQQTRIAGGNDNRAAAEVRVDENCLASWQAVMARDFGGSSPFAACAPE